MILRIYLHLAICLLSLAYCVARVEIPEDWIDPHDMRPSADYLLYTDGSLPLDDYYKERNKGPTNCECDLSDKMSEAYFRRTINLLLKAVHEDRIEQDVYSGHLFFKIQSENFEVLRNFANDNNNGNADFVKIDNILSQILSKPTEKHLQEYLEGYFHKFLNIMLTKQGIITVICCAYFYVIYKMFIAKFYWRYVLKFLFCNFVIFDFAFTWIQLYKKAEIEKMANMAKYKGLPMECNPAQMDSWQFFWNVFNKEDACQKYYEVNYQDIFWTVSPGLVVSEMFSNLVKGPLLTLGGAFSGTCSQIYNSLPWGVNILLTPILLLFILLNICLVLSLIISTPFSVNVFNLFSFKFDDLPWPINILIFPVALLFLCILIAIILSFLFTGSIKFNLFFHLFSLSVSGHRVTNPTLRSDHAVTDPRVDELLQRIEQLPYREPRAIASTRAPTCRLEEITAPEQPRKRVKQPERLENLPVKVAESAKVTEVGNETDRDDECEMSCQESGDSCESPGSSQTEIVDEGRGDSRRDTATPEKGVSGSRPDLTSRGAGDCN